MSDMFVNFGGMESICELLCQYKRVEEQHQNPTKITECFAYGRKHTNDG